MQYYEQYLRDRNAANFGQSLEKVAAYYMTKSKLEEDFKGNWLWISKIYVLNLYYECYWWVFV